MRQAYPWMTMVLFLGCLFLGYLVLQQKTEILQVNLRQSDADRTLGEQTAQLEKRLAIARAAQAQAAKQAAQAKTAAGPPAGLAAADRNRNILTLHVSEIVKEHPEYAAIWAAQQRRGVLSNFGPLLDAMHLTPEQVAKLKDLFVERSNSEEDAQQAAREAGLAQGTPAWRDAIKQAQAAVEQQMTAVVGSDGSAFAQQLQNEASAQSQIQYQYGLDFKDAGVALSSDQFMALTQAIANASYSGKSTADRPANYNEVDSDTMLTPHDNRILTAAAAALSPDQLEIFRTDLMQVHQQAAVMQEYSAGANGRPVNFVP